jgi:hypothetical protein
VANLLLIGNTFIENILVPCGVKDVRKNSSQIMIFKSIPGGFLVPQYIVTNTPWKKDAYLSGKKRS